MKSRGNADSQKDNDSRTGVAPGHSHMCALQESFRVHAYYPPTVDLDQLAPDYLSLFALMFGVVGYLFEWKLVSWVSVVCLLSSLARLRRSTVDLKQIFCAVICVASGLLVNYGSGSLYCDEATN
mmetsp:Transcript_3582/g.6965  ORF Transcript_3582/g.6965 Transcript_3582/m.6965 type:complete len:125 (+) Transcript_3582:40-414(+)